MKGLFSDGHPLGYHLAAVTLAMVSLGTAFASTILAEDTTSGTSGSTTTTTSCSYSYSSWSVCNDGKRYRTVTGYSPTGCVQSQSPDLQESCTMPAPQCAYSYSNWGSCQSNGERLRTLVSKSPSGCQENVEPVLKQSCTFIASTTTTAPITTSTTTSSPATATTTACAYAYSAWSACQTDGRRSRTVTSTTPVGCVQTTAPKTTESCTYTATTTTSASESTSTTTSGTTTAVQCGYQYSDWRACQSDGKRKRDLVSKSPSGCQEYVRPVLEQSCVYDGSVLETSTTTSTTSSTTGATSTSTTTLAPTATTAETDTEITPKLTFKNVSDGTRIKDTFDIRAEVRKASSVELYLVPDGSSAQKYIGGGKRISETEWQFAFRSGDVSNGEYFLRAKIKNMYGEYGSGQRKIAVVNDRLATTLTATALSGFVPLEMTDDEKRAILSQFRTDLALPSTTTTDDTKETKSPDEEKKAIFDYCQSNPEKCQPERDTDKDGLSDIDEIRYGTNPKAADSDLDGFIDGDEVKHGFNPLKYSGGDKSDRIVFESPKDAGEVKAEIYTVKTVELKEVKDENGETKKKMQLSGKGLPNSFVTIYIYSDPIVLTVKTDSEGNWTYELDKEVDDGEHEVYVAITDNTGKITAKSQALGFVKTAQAVTVIPAAEASLGTETMSVSKTRAQKDMLILVSIVIAALAVALAVIGLIKHRHATAKEDFQPS